jgi:integrase
MKSNGKKRAEGTINKYLKTLKQFFDTPMARRHCKNPPEIKILKEPERTPSPITHEAAEKILKVAPLHLQNLLILCMHTGMREQEALTLKTSQFNEDLKTIYLDTNTKTKKGRRVLVNDEAFQIIKQCKVMGDQLWEQLQSDHALAKEYAKKYQIKTRGDIPFILYKRHSNDILRPINSVKSAWYKALRTAGLEGQFRFHDSRASFCSYLAQGGSNPLGIRELVGHKDIKTTMRYIGLLGNAGQRAAVDALSKTLPFNVKGAVEQPT